MGAFLSALFGGDAPPTPQPGDPNGTATVTPTPDQVAANAAVLANIANTTTPANPSPVTPSAPAASTTPTPSTQPASNQNAGPTPEQAAQAEMDQLINTNIAANPFWLDHVYDLIQEQPPGSATATYWQAVLTRAEALRAAGLLVAPEGKYRMVEWVDNKPPPGAIPFGPTTYYSNSGIHCVFLLDGTLMGGWGIYASTTAANVGSVLYQTPGQTGYLKTSGVRMWSVVPNIPNPTQVSVKVSGTGDASRALILYDTPIGFAVWAGGGNFFFTLQPVPGGRTQAYPGAWYLIDNQA